MPLTDSLRDDILAAVPSLRAFAISLCGNGDRADDLVQETLLRALANIDSFQPGSNLPAWLFTILRNLFRSDYRKRRREVEDADGNYAKTLKTQPSQSAHLEFEEFRVALDKLPLAVMQAIEPRIGKAVFGVLSIEASVKSRTAYGGTAPKNVRAQAKRWLKRLQNKS